MKLYLIRHGLPNYEKDCLTDRGTVEAENVAMDFDDVDFDLIYASTNGRARETAEHTSRRQNNKPIIPCDWAREDEGGQYFILQEGDKQQWPFWHKEMSRIFFSEEIMNMGYKWYEHPMLKDYKFKQGVEIMNKWADDFLLELGYEHDRVNHTYKKVKETPNNVALFAHGAFAFSFLSSLLEIPYPIFTTRMTCLDCTGYVIINFEDDYPTCFPYIKTFNSITHLKNRERKQDINNLKR